eukprot:7671-Chlamydomonas_euryale.AAC.4
MSLAAHPPIHPTTTRPQYICKPFNGDACRLCCWGPCVLRDAVMLQVTKKVLDRGVRSGRLELDS